MFVFLPKETFFITRTGKAHQCWTVDNTGELVSIKQTATLKDIAFVEGDNFYTHWQDMVKYYTVGAEDLIMVQEFKAQLPNVGFHSIHDRYVDTKNA